MREDIEKKAMLNSTHIIAICKEEDFEPFKDKEPESVVMLTVQYVKEALETLEKFTNQGEMWLKVYGKDLPIFLVPRKDCEMGIAIAPRMEP